MTADEFRALALSFPEALEAAHRGHPDFRVKGKIFATIWPDDSWGMVKLTPEQQRLFIKSKPGIFSPVKGAWGRRGATRVRLAAVSKEIGRKALETEIFLLRTDFLAPFAPHFRDSDKRFDFRSPLCLNRLTAGQQKGLAVATPEP